MSHIHIILMSPHTMTLSSTLLKKTLSHLLRV